MVSEVHVTQQASKLISSMNAAQLAQLSTLVRSPTQPYDLVWNILEDSHVESSERRRR